MKTVVAMSLRAALVMGALAVLGWAYFDPRVMSFGSLDGDLALLRLLGWVTSPFTLAAFIAGAAVLIGMRRGRPAPTGLDLEDAFDRTHRAA